MVNIDSCTIGALEERALVALSYITLHLADSSDHEVEKKRWLSNFLQK